MATGEGSSYQCSICNEPTFKSRNHWLVHLVLAPHSLKARKSFPRWKSTRHGEIYVISGLAQVENSMLLEYISDNLRTFSDIVFFKPEANVCMIVCDAREGDAFLARHHKVGGIPIFLKADRDMSPVEWWSFFKDGAGVPQEGSKPVQGANKRKFSEEDQEAFPSVQAQNPTKVPRLIHQPSSQQRPAPPRPQTSSVPGRSLPNTQPPIVNQSRPQPAPPQSGSGRSVPYTQPPIKNQVPRHPQSLPGPGRSVPNASSPPVINQSRPQPVPTHSQTSTVPPSPPPQPVPPHLLEKWDEEMERLQNVIFMSDEHLFFRRKIVEEITVVLRISFPKCQVIPVGADFLGFNLENSLFSVYADTNGFTSAEHASPKCEVIENLQSGMDRIRTAVFNKLKSLETAGKVSQVQCFNAISITFFHINYNIKCKVLLKPFMVAQNARLCKQLYSMNPQVSSLVNMVVYWCMQHSTFTDVGLCNPFVVLWLVYFFFMTKNVLPSVAEMQANCPYEVIDDKNNVAFPYDEGVFADVISKQTSNQSSSTQSQVELLLEWFQYIDDTLGECTGKGENRRHSLICPRFARLIDKRKFKVVWEKFRDKKKKLYNSDQKKVRKFWRQDLIDYGFEEEMWEKLLGLKMPDTLSIQHPLYIKENISLAFDGRFSRIFFNAVKMTKDNLKKLLRGDAAVPSLLQALSGS